MSISAGSAVPAMFRSKRARTRGWPASAEITSASTNVSAPRTTSSCHGSSHVFASAGAPAHTASTIQPTLPMARVSLRPGPWHTSHMKRLLPLAFLLACAKPAPPAAPPPPPLPPPASSEKVSGSGRPVLFFPGLAGPGGGWAAPAPHLGGKVQAHVLTLAGFAGEKPIPPPFLPTVREQIAAYIQANRLERPIIVGHSLGGAMAYWLAETVPDLGGIIVVDGLPFFPAA